jgi:hypothetical protein
MSLATYTLLFIYLLVISCGNTIIESPKEFVGTPVSISSLSKTYREIALFIKDESFYISSHERWERFMECLYSERNGTVYDLQDSDDNMSTVNTVLKRCLPEDKKIRYFSPEWYRAHNACPEVGKGASIEIKREIKIPYRIIKRINTGYIIWKDIDSFGLSNMVEVLRTFKESDIDTVIFDMRDNTGGNISDMESFLRLVLKGRKEPYFIARGSHQRAGEFVVRKDGEFSHFRIIVLVNEKSASATEIIAGVLQRQGAIVIGGKTYGKGTVQERGILYLIDGDCHGSLKLTTRQIFFDDGTSPEGTGIIPDIVVADSEDVLEKAIEYISQGKLYQRKIKQ